MTDSTLQRTPGSGQFETSIDSMTVAAEAARLRATGMSYRQIAAEMDVSPTTARDRVLRALAAVPVEAVGELRKVELERLDMLVSMAFKIATSEHKMVSHGKVIEGVLDITPNLVAIRELRMLSESRRKLLGLDSPQQHVVTVSDAMTAEIERLAAELGAVDAPLGQVLVPQT